jgi:hypothetical protein
VAAGLVLCSRWASAPSFGRRSLSSLAPAQPFSQRVDQVLGHSILVDVGPWLEERADLVDQCHNSELYGDFKACVEIMSTSPCRGSPSRNVWLSMVRMAGAPIRGRSTPGFPWATGSETPRSDGELKSRDAEAWCGLLIVNLTSDDVVEWIKLKGRITELFDVTVMPGVVCPMSIGPDTAELHNTTTFDPDARPTAREAA